MKKEDVFLKKDHCPHCKAYLDCASNIESETLRPKPGDVSICIKCGTFLEFDENLTLIYLSDEHFKQLAAKAQEQLKFLKKEILYFRSKIN